MWGWGNASNNSDLNNRGTRTGGLQVKKGYKLKACTGDNLTGTCYNITGRGVHGTNSQTQLLENNLRSLQVIQLPYNPTPYTTNELSPRERDTANFTNAYAMCPLIGDADEIVRTNGDQIKCKFVSINESTTIDDLNNYFPNSERNRFLNTGGRCDRLSITELTGSWADECIDALSQNSYDGLLLRKCEQNNWTTLPQCVNKVRSVIQNNTNSANTAQSMVHKYCRGGDGTNKKGMGPGRNTQLCACLNASDLGFAGENSCYATANQQLPGCQELILKTQKVVSVEPSETTLQAIQTNVSDPGKIVSACGEARQACNGSSCILPYDPNAVAYEVNFNICDLRYRAGIAQDSPVIQTCSIDTGTGTNGADGTNGANGADGTNGSNGADGTNGSNTKYYIGGGVGSFISVSMSMLLVIIIVMFIF
jgi:hypothetical protein